MSYPVVEIRKGREKPIRNQHPWIFSGAIYQTDAIAAGEIVDVVDYSGRFLARGYYNPKSQIQVRILTWDKDEIIDENWWQKALRRSVSARQDLTIIHTSTTTQAYRLINAENDFIPGLIVDRYGDYLVLQALTYYIDTQKHIIAQLLSEIVDGIKGVYERSDVDVRGKEGLGAKVGVLWGDEPNESVIINDGGVTVQVDINQGHKTGYYLDQSGNRLLLQQMISNFDNASEMSLLNCFCYTGAFSLHAYKAGLTNITSVDSSAEALQLAENSYELNNFDDSPSQFIQADVFDYLRDATQEGESYDIVILDPPKFAHNKRQVDKAARGYKDINLNAFKLIKPGGYLWTFSCSGAISQDLFQKIVFGALADSGRQAQIIQYLNASPDHPTALTFPEGDYLKGFIIRVY